MYYSRGKRGREGEGERELLTTTDLGLKLIFLHEGHILIISTVQTANDLLNTYLTAKCILTDPSSQITV